MDSRFRGKDGIWLMTCLSPSPGKPIFHSDSRLPLDRLPQPADIENDLSDIRFTGWLFLYAYAASSLFPDHVNEFPKRGADPAANIEYARSRRMESKPVHRFDEVFNVKVITNLVAIAPELERPVLGYAGKQVADHAKATAQGLPRPVDI